MPLIILGLILIIAVVIYWVVANSNTDDGKVDTSPIKEHYSHVFEEKTDKARDAAQGVKDDLAKKIRKRAGIYDVDFDIEDDGYGESPSKNAEDNSIPFPDDVELAKKEHNIK